MYDKIVINEINEERKPLFLFLSKIKKTKTKHTKTVNLV